MKNAQIRSLSVQVFIIKSILTMKTSVDAFLKNKFSELETKFNQIQFRKDIWWEIRQEVGKSVLYHSYPDPSLPSSLKDEILLIFQQAKKLK